MSHSVDHDFFDAGPLTSANLPIRTEPTIDGTALDAVVEALMTSGNAAGRAHVICALLDEIFAAVEWLQREGLSAAESASLQHVRNAAYQHRRQMSLSRVGHRGEPDK